MVIFRVSNGVENVGTVEVIDMTIKVTKGEFVNTFDNMKDVIKYINDNRLELIPE